MIGTIFMGKYEVRRLLGEGGMGKVYLARQLDRGREVVVKVMHESIATDAKFRDRFMRETQLMARFQHPRAVALYDATLDDPHGPCIVMEYVKGINLEVLLAKNKRLGAARVGRIVNELCEVLQAAHDEGIIHRDLKPANLMVVDADSPRERVRVMDFGLAKLVEGEPGTRNVTDTNVEFAVGTPGYICPEQVRGEEMDHRGDLYSVGVMMYELLTGRLPFTGLNSMDILLAHATDNAATFAEMGLTAWVPAEVEELVFATMAKNPEDRPQSARELAERFHTALTRALEAEAQEAQEAEKNAHSIGMNTPPNYRHRPLTAITPPPSAAPTAVYTNSSREQASLPFHMESSMPETIALMKLRGFVHDAGGEVVESVPGLIKVRLGGRKNSGSGLLSWLGIRRLSNSVDVEIHMHHLDPNKANQITFHILFRPSHPSLLNDRDWRQRCTQVFHEIRAYLVGRNSE